ncbi:NAD-dependent epimerase/dehydratase family protein [Shimia biformata]|uniref:NAD-dependent epimerase/dehydratase family protein n=1 Tax=Shimia biformata TaxID=1294299 RepID=UPI00194FF782|nr:NAD(P)-dependent oxidoreductase [Shimia biformata]
MGETLAASIPRVLILGANGRIGRLLRLVWGTGARFQLDPVWQCRNPVQGDSTQCIALDFMADPDGLIKAMTGSDCVLVLAGVTPGLGVAEARFADNSRIAQAVLDAAMIAKPARVFLTSSAAVYGVASAGLDGHAETGATQPAAPYGLSKLHMEQVAAAHPFARTTCLRIGNVAGADQLLGPGLRSLIALDVFPGGNGPLRSYLGPKALADILASLIRAPMPLPPVLNVGGDDAVDMLDLVVAAGMRIQRRDAPDGLPERVALDTHLLQRHITLPKGTSDAATIVQDWQDVTRGNAI